MSLTAEDIRNCTMIALDQPPWWPVEADDYFKFTVRITGTSESPLRYSGPDIEAKDIVVLWGDGESDEYSTYYGRLEHTYDHVGTYQITIKTSGEYGSLPYCYFGQHIIGGGYPDNYPTYSLISIDSPIPRGACEISRTIESGRDVYCYRNNFTFYSCVNLQSIPQNLFSKVSELWMTPLIDNDGTLEPYTGTLSISAGSQFRYCKALEHVPDYLYKDTGSSSFNSTFYHCEKLAEIPEHLFEGAIKATTFSGCFTACKKITEIPEGIFDGLTMVQSFNACFSGCSITEIPDGLFDDNTLVADFGQTFRSCDHLLEIPSGLFDNNTRATSFTYCFSGTKITSIPDGLFRYTTRVTNFSYCFTFCPITSIPSGLFRYTTRVTNFSHCFDMCESLLSIPSGLFAYTTRVTNFSYCFRGDEGITSNLPELWTSFPNANGSKCYAGCYNAANYSSVPADWN